MKNYEIRINKFAQNDIFISVDFYNRKQKGLGKKFWKEIKIKLEKIATNPFQYQIIKDKTRKANTKKFSFGIFYLINDNFIDIFAVIHNSRSNEIWEKRINK